MSPEEVTSLEQAVSDEALIESAAFCTGSALEKLADTPEFSRVARRALKAWPFIALLDKVFKVVDIPTSVRRLGKRLREGQFHDVGTAVTRLIGEEDTRKSVTLFLYEYIRSWNNLPVERRRAAVTSLISHLREPCIWALAKVFVRQRDHLRRARVLASHPLLRELRRRVQSLLNDDLAKAVGDAVHRALSSIPAHEFRRNLECRTRIHLEAIRINGAVLGLALGALLGFVDAISR